MIDWIIYTRSDPPCPWCERTKIFLSARGIEFEERDYKTLYDNEIWVHGAPFTVPQIYHKGMLIGGYEKMKEYIDYDT